MLKIYLIGLIISYVIAPIAIKIGQKINKITKDNISTAIGFSILAPIIWPIVAILGFIGGIIFIGSSIVMLLAEKASQMKFFSFPNVESK